MTVGLGYEDRRINFYGNFTFRVILLTRFFQRAGLTGTGRKFFTGIGKLMFFWIKKNTDSLIGNNHKCGGKTSETGVFAGLIRGEFRRHFCDITTFDKVGNSDFGS